MMKQEKRSENRARLTSEALGKPLRSIVLIGFMGCGKSSVGRLLAREKDWRRVDTDELLAAKFGLSISEIFQRWGEERFRAAETEILRDMESKRAGVLVTGGGVVLRPENIQRLREIGTVVWLTADLATLEQRLGQLNDRPLLQTADPRKTIATLLEERRKFYETAADFVIDTSRLSQREVVQAICDAIRIER
jgi:shikimate kinase